MRGVQAQAQVLVARGEAAVQAARLAPPVRWVLRWVRPTQPVARGWRGWGVAVWVAASRPAAPAWAVAGSWVVLAA